MMRITKNVLMVSIAVMFFLAGCGPATPKIEATASTPSGAPTAPIDLPGTAAVEPTATPIPTQLPTAILPSPTSQKARYWVFPPYGSGGTKAWQIDGEQISELTLPDEMNNTYDHASVTGKILHSSHFQDKGAGPANLSVGDLWSYAIQSQQDQLIFQDENIVEAIWAPNGEDFAYLKATPDTYELHWRTASGEDKLLAVDVSPTFSVSPDGQSVAFTRETGYKVGQPGVYLVKIQEGAERKIASVDRGGMGSISDLPLWSPNGDYILLPVSSPDTPTHWVLIKTDGSFEAPVQFGPDVPEEFRRGDFAFSLWLPDSQRVLINQLQGQVGPPNAQETGVASLDLTNGQITEITPVSFGAASPLMWIDPGKSAWQMTDNGDLAQLDLDNPRPLPRACIVSGQELFVNPYKGYCFSYPPDVILQGYEYERPLFLGPAPDQSVEPLQSRLWVQAKPVPAGSSLTSAVDAFIGNLPQGVPAPTRQPFTLGGEPAEILEGVPGQLFSRVVLALHKDTLYQLWFNPVDDSVPQVQPEIEKLFEAVVSSFSFLP
jgi:hypothetical protein